MSKIDELIKELCPNGVEYKTLKEVSKITTGKLNANKATSNGNYSFFTCGKDVLKINDYAFDCEALLVSGNGANVGYIHYYKGKFNAYQRTYVISSFDAKVNIIFIKYLLDNYLKKHITENKKDSGIPYIVLDTLADFSIPIPPIEIQNEIVNILDKFVEFEAELEAELEARKIQYEFYREEILSSKNFVKLKDIAKLKNGKDWKHLNEGEYPVYGTGGVMCYVDEYVYAKPTVLIPRKGSIGNIYFVDEPFWNIDTIYYVDINQETILPKYLYYFLTSVDLTKLDTGSGRPSLTQAILDNIDVSLPPLLEQQRIVKMLDKFDKLINDISEGLPAEIEMRKKQYEYYRDKLLTFEELNNE